MSDAKTFEVHSANLGTVQVAHRDCPLCGRNNSDQRDNPYSYDVWVLKDCAACGFTYIDRGPDYAKLFDELSWETTSLVEERRRQSLRPVGYKISKASRLRMRLLPRKQIPLMLEAWAKPGNILDLGCGDGGPLDKLSLAFTPYGIEVSTALAKVADQRFSVSGGACINAPTLDGLKSLPAGAFTAATMRSYLEHEMNPLAVLHETYRTLKAAGVVIVKVPNYDSLNRRVMGSRWCGFRYPDHLNYFTPKTLRAMAQKAGFSVHYGMTYTLPTSDNMYAVFKKD